MKNDIVLQLENVSKSFKRRSFRGGESSVHAVKDVSFSVKKDQSFGLVGESGSGKTTLAKIMTGITMPDSGRVELNGSCDVVFQDPYSSLNPRMNVLQIVGEGVYIKGLRGKKLREKVSRMLELVRLSPSDMEKYPHEFSGGERQRVAIARALIRGTDLLVLDEPVSSLDVSIQAGILNLLKDIKDELGISMVFISHDMRVVEYMSDVVAVMKEGRIVEQGGRREIYLSPKNEYTRSLLEVIPRF